MTKAESRELKLTPEELALLRHICSLGYGSVTVSVQKGTPVRIEQIRESIQL